LRRSTKLAAGLVLALPGPAWAQAYQCRVPQTVNVPRITPDAPPRRTHVTGYTLALSWSPEFCKRRQASRADTVQCSGRNGRFAFVVHGLWPEGRATWPQWCASRPAPSPAEVRRNLCMMPSARMQAHEWAKHGSCMARRPETYFKVTRILWHGLRMPDFDRLSRDPQLTAGAIREAVASANPGWRSEAIGLVVNGRGWLEELRLCYAKDFMPTPCDRRRFGPADGARVKVWRGL
jgi:ribonuclease T2